MLNGISFLRSKVSPDQVTDGLSQTYLIGEKYCVPRLYINGQDLGDGEAATCGFSDNTGRVAGGPDCVPRQDVRGFRSVLIWGSPHTDGAHFVFCDGSVHTISYEIDPAIHRQLANRRDGEKVDRGDFQKWASEVGN